MGRSETLYSFATKQSGKEDIERLFAEQGQALDAANKAGIPLEEITIICFFAEITDEEAQKLATGQPIDAKQLNYKNSLQEKTRLIFNPSKS